MTRKVDPHATNWPKICVPERPSTSKSCASRLRNIYAPRASTSVHAPAWHAQLVESSGFHCGLSEHRIGFPFFRGVGHDFTFALGECAEGKY